MSDSITGLWWPRRRALLAALSATTFRAGAAAAPAPRAVRAVSVAEPMRQVHAGGPTGLLGTSASGSLWALSLTGQAPRRIANELDPATPIATGHGRIAARTSRGGLWVFEDGRESTLDSADLAEHAGLLVLPLAVVAVVTGGSRDAGRSGHRLARFEPDNAGPWREVARSQDAVLPDARPVQVDLDGRGDGGHIVMLAGPDGSRYTHGVLGDGIEATRMLWLERHGLGVLRSLTLPPPHVFEDIAPRPVQLPGLQPGAGLLTVRSGPEGGQLALVATDPLQTQALRVAALGDTVGGFHRWLAPSAQGTHLVAVHTPHIGGVLHVYRLDGQRLSRRRVLSDVSTHQIGARVTDLSVWLRGRVVLPSQDGQRLRLLDPAADWAELITVALPGRVTMTTPLTDGSALAALLADGRVVLAEP